MVSNSKKSKKAPAPPVDEEPPSSSDDDDVVAPPPPPIDADADAEKGAEEEEEEEEQAGEDGENGDEGAEEPSESAEQRERNARKRRRVVARRKGYRQLATKGGYSTTALSMDASRDVAQNMVSIKETIRACKWAPALPDSAAYSTFEEYAERLKLSQEPLPQGPAAVYRASGEVFLRKVMNECMQRTFDAGKTRVSINTVASVLRPLQPILNHEFAAPIGLVRHAQTTLVGGEGKESPALGTLEHDDAQMSKERKSIAPKQVELFKAVQKAMLEQKKEKERKKAAPAGGPEPTIGKGKKKRTAAA